MSRQTGPDPALPAGLSHVLRLADLPQRKPTRFALTPDAEICAALAADLGLSDLRKLRFAGQLTPMAGRDWHLEAQLGATLVQPCGITLDPVRTRIDQPVQRQYSDRAEAAADLPAGTEMEMPQDDTLEPLPAVIDLGQVLLEELILAIPPFPRAPGAELGSVLAAPEDIAPLDDAAMKPFAGLAALRDSLSGKDEP